jgi:hypothetical protein
MILVFSKQSVSGAWTQAGTGDIAWFTPTSQGVAPPPVTGTIVHNLPFFVTLGQVRSF